MREVRADQADPFLGSPKNQGKSPAKFQLAEIFNRRAAILRPETLDAAVRNALEMYDQFLLAPLYLAP